ncbi:winged helix-turn-helix domain-containing protein [Vibrio sp. vnigr-6D03]|uniref:winged helix-turn-helix domain-containing protein n=1 Tax=Vibrio sp. vnigr-6D03 TaxID=2058088 RepID=UPI0015E0EA8C|nr:winged helix-turn-helix domain-containing protein [Vibrio sp. vnigr-6D03]
MIQFGEYRFDAEKECLILNDEPVAVRNKVHQLLCYFLENPERIISKEELLAALWTNGDYRERSLSQSVLELRKLLGDSASSPRFVRTIPNQGYKWIAAITPVDEQPSHWRRNSFAALSVVLLILATLLWVFNQEGSMDFSDRKIRVAVLPFENATQLDSYHWIEYGLSDMLATDLMLYPDVQVYPPNQVKAKRKALEDWRSNDFSSSSVNVAIFASVSLKQGRQIISYTILDEQLNQTSGEIEKQDLALSMPSIASSIVHLLRPAKNVAVLPEYEFEVNAMHEYAKGQHALSQRGCKLAQHYFAASYTIDLSHEWSVLQYAICQLELGNREEAQINLQSLLESSPDPIVIAMSHLWLAEMWMRKGELDKAEMHLSQSHYSEVIGANYFWLEQGKEIDYYLGYLLNRQRLEHSPLGSDAIPSVGAPPWHTPVAGAELTVSNHTNQTSFPQKMMALLRFSRSQNLETKVRITALEEALAINEMVGSRRAETSILLDLIYWKIHSGQHADAKELTTKLEVDSEDFLVQSELTILQSSLENTR